MSLEQRAYDYAYEQKNTGFTLGEFAANTKVSQQAAFSCLRILCDSSKFLSRFDPEEQRTKYYASEDAEGDFFQLFNEPIKASPPNALRQKRYLSEQKEAALLKFIKDENLKGKDVTIHELKAKFNYHFTVLYKAVERLRQCKKITIKKIPYIHHGTSGVIRGYIPVEEIQPGSNVGPAPITQKTPITEDGDDFIPQMKDLLALKKEVEGLREKLKTMQNEKRNRLLEERRIIQAELDDLLSRIK